MQAPRIRFFGANDGTSVLGSQIANGSEASLGLLDLVLDRG